MNKVSQILIRVLGLVLVIVILLIIYFLIPYSPLKNKFKADFNQIDASQTKNEETMKKTDFNNFPKAIQKYMTNNGYIGQEKMTYAFITYKDVNFAQSPERRLTIDYSQYNFAKYPIRLALVKSSMMGIPFEGYDYYKDGKGGMQGMLAKAITIFNQQGSEMDRGALCTYLSECLFVPSSILAGNIIFEEIDPYNVRATINDSDISVSGIFTFNENYEMTRFYTEDRPLVKDDGTVIYIPWSANVISYKKLSNGIKFPEHVQISWHYPEGDLIYFDGIISDVVFD